jgi:hypothetical protein
MSSQDVVEQTPRFCLSVVLDGDLSALTRVLGYFQNLNVLPNRISGFFDSSIGYFEIDVSDLAEERMALIAAKVLQQPTVLRASLSVL